jgi:O-6-methylguanine DNA methyltransferase
MTTEPNQIVQSSRPSPIGELNLFTCNDKVVAIEFADQGRTIGILGRHLRSVAIVTGPAPGSLRAALEEYFDCGDCSGFDDLTLSPLGTPFQRLVWARLQRVSPGATISYSDLARSIGRPRAARAVGLANGHNPIPIIIPCHRVIGANGALTGYGGGLDRKAWLLEHERSFFPLAAA